MISITEEAVEVAAKATFLHANFGSPWEDAGSDWKDAYRESVREGLEAAAPYLYDWEAEGDGDPS